MSEEGIGRNGGPRIAGVGILLALSLAGLLGACDDGPPTRPSPPSAAPNVPVTITRLEIAGPGTVPPGESAQYSAIAHQSDGSTRDVTNEATWFTGSQAVLTISATGLATARERGETYIGVSANGLRAGKDDVVVVPAGTFRLRGAVRDAGLPVSGALVDVTAGTGLGLATTSGDGAYRLYGASGDIEVRVIRDGYQEERKSLLVTSHTTLDFDLILSHPRDEVAGAYTLTVTAADECRMLTEDVRTRRYTAVLRQDGPKVTATLDGGTFAVETGRTLNRFAGTVEPNRVAFHLGGFDPYSHYLPDVLEQLPTSMFYTVSGSAVTTASPAALSGTLNGYVETLQKVAPETFMWFASCYSTRHRFVFSR